MNRDVFNKACELQASIDKLYVILRQIEVADRVEINGVSMLSADPLGAAIYVKLREYRNQLQREFDAL